MTASASASDSSPPSGTTSSLSIRPPPPPSSLSTLSLSNVLIVAFTLSLSPLSIYPLPPQHIQSLSSYYSININISSTTTDDDDHDDSNFASSLLSLSLSLSLSLMRWLLHSLFLSLLSRFISPPFHPSPSTSNLSQFNEYCINIISTTNNDNHDDGSSDKQTPAG